MAVKLAWQKHGHHDTIRRLSRVHSPACTCEVNNCYMYKLYLCMRNIVLSRDMLGSRDTLYILMCGASLLTIPAEVKVVSFAVATLSVSTLHQFLFQCKRARRSSILLQCDYQVRAVSVAQRVKPMSYAHAVVTMCRWFCR